MATSAFGLKGFATYSSAPACSALEAPTSFPNTLNMTTLVPEVAGSRFKARQAVCFGNEHVQEYQVRILPGGEFQRQLAISGEQELVASIQLQRKLEQSENALLIIDHKYLLGHGHFSARGRPAPRSARSRQAGALR